MTPSVGRVRSRTGRAQVKTGVSSSKTLHWPPYWPPYWANRVTRRCRSVLRRQTDTVTEGAGFEIAVGDPFADPPEQRDPARRLRGRLTAPVTVWTAGTGRAMTGCTVSSVLLAAGEPAHLLGLLSPDADLADTLEDTGRFVVHVLALEHRALADGFAGLRPAPGGMFREQRYEQTPYGPELTGIANRARCRVTDVRTVGWSLLVEAEVIDILAGDLDQPLLYTRGRYCTLDRG